jgi:hypothetical protein
MQKYCQFEKKHKKLRIEEKEWKMRKNRGRKSLFYYILAEIPGVARDSRKSERIRVICLSPGSE